MRVSEGQSSVLERAVNGDFTALNELRRDGSDDAYYVRLDLSSFSNCTDSRFLTIQSVLELIDKDGDTKTDTDALVTNLVITQAQEQLTREAGLESPIAES